MPDETEKNSIAALPQGTCSMCERQAELLKVEVSYPLYWSQKQICAECIDRLSVAISRALAEVRW